MLNHSAATIDRFVRSGGCVPIDRPRNLLLALRIAAGATAAISAASGCASTPSVHPPEIVAANESIRLANFGLAMSVVPPPPLPDPASAPAPHPPASPPPPPQIAPSEPDLAPLVSPAAGVTRDQRAAAARRAILSDTDSCRTAIAGILRDGPADARTIVLRETASLASAPDWLGPLIAPLVATPQPETRLAAYAAASSVHTHEGAGSLVARLQDAPRPEATAIRRALVRMTGRTDLGPEFEPWSAWLQRTNVLSDAAWHQSLTESLAARSDEQAQAADAIAQRLAGELRRGYVALETPAQRSAMLVSLLGDDLPAVRRVGLQLATQELASGRVPGEDVAEAVLARLRDSAPDIRALAAELINRLPATPALGPAANAALREESDPDAAMRLLPAAARWPEADSLRVSLMWLDSSGPVRDAAILAVDSFERANMLGDPADRQRVLVALRAIPPANLPGAGLRLLFALGDEADRARITALLRHESAPVRLRAAEALSGAPSALDALLDAARADPSLFNAAAGAIALHRATPEGFDALAGLPVTDPQTKRETLLNLAGRLSPADLLVVARKTDDLEFREALLLRMTPEPAAPLPGSPGTFNPRSLRPVADAALLLAGTRLQMMQPASALSALDGAAPALSMFASEEAAPLRCCALLQLNRLGDAESLSAPLDAWFDGLQRSVNLPHAAAIVVAIHRLFGDSLTDADRSRLDALAERVQRAAEFVGPPVR